MISQQNLAKLRRFLELREKRDEAKTALDTAEKDYREAEADVYEALTEAELKGAIKVDLGDGFGTVSFSPRTTYFGRIIDKEAAEEYYAQRAMLEDVSEIKFSMARIHEEIRERLENGESPPPGMDYYSRRGVTVTRQKK